MEEEQLTKRERKKLAREQKLQEQEKAQKSRQLRNLFIGLFVIGLLAGGFWVVWKEFNKPFPGESVPDMGRDHVSDISQVEYNSNPPTSGSHFGIWAKRGVYDRVISDGHLIHSLEHGYVVVSYNCGEPVSLGDALTKPIVSQEGGMSFFTPKNAPEPQFELPESFNSQECEDIVNKLSTLLNDLERVIVVPRPNLDAEVAATAWNRILKLNELDMQKIREFASAWHNRGPEKTVE